MQIEFTGLRLSAQDHPDCQMAARLFQEELILRTGCTPAIQEAAALPPEGPAVLFALCGAPTLPDKDSFQIQREGARLTISAWGRRGLIYGFGMFLRKTEYHDGRILLVREISGIHTPRMKIRGHQTGYRATPNTYDAWGPAQFERCYRDMMLFGANTCEVIPKDEQDTGPLMRYDADDMCALCSEIADRLDLDVSVWYPFSAKQAREEMLREREALFARMARIDAVFPPGGDPGELPAQEFVERCVLLRQALRKFHPRAELWPSAQAPHSQPDWGEEFLAAAAANAEQIDGVIYGPNHAMPLETLHRRLPTGMPLRFYPDITHSQRCEYPVRYWADDWHYAFGCTSGREGVDPRPLEFARLHRETKRFFQGSVSYSEGVHDDVNKALWSALDFCPEEPVEEILLDYARAFLWEAPAERIMQGILMLERNWEGDPAQRPEIDRALSLWQDMAQEAPSLLQNWRFLLLLFRAECDALVRRRRIFEMQLLARAKACLRRGDRPAALAALRGEMDAGYRALRETIHRHAAMLFGEIGIQLDVEHYGAKSWERGATLDTLDLPVTDRPWLLHRLELALQLPEPVQSSCIAALLSREEIQKGEVYFSFARDGLAGLHAQQEGEWYMNVRGDCPSVNNGQLPMALTKLYDHFSLRARFTGLLPDTDYLLRVVYSGRKMPPDAFLRITANGQTVYEGTPYGGIPDPFFDEWMLAPGVFSATYPLPAGKVRNGVLDLLWREETRGIEIAELWIIKA